MLNRCCANLPSVGSRSNGQAPAPPKLPTRPSFGRTRAQLHADGHTQDCGRKNFFGFAENFSTLRLRPAQALDRCGCHPPFGRPTTASVKGLRSIAGHSSSLRSDEHPSMRQRNVGTVVGKIFRLRRNFPSLRPTQRRPLTVVGNIKK